MPKASGLICCSDVESSLQFFTVCVGVDACEGGRERESGACARVTTLVESEPELSITRKRENPRTRKSWSAEV